MRGVKGASVRVGDDNADVGLGGVRPIGAEVGTALVVGLGLLPHFTVAQNHLI